MTSPADLLPSGKPRRPIRPLHGIPDRDPRGKLGLVLSTLFHLAIIVMVLLPPALATSLVLEDTAGAGGAGPEGGGGGGTGGTGGEKTTPERLRYVQVAPIPQVKPSTLPQIVPPQPKPPEPVKPPEPEPTPPTPTTTPQPPAAPTNGPTNPTPGVGGGSGHDGSGGNGPGSGGGVGSGQGTGRGSGVGPGTGGSGGEIFPPRVQNLPLMPMPVPNRVRPYNLVAVFDVDEKGNATLIAFNPSRDSGYNKKVREMLAELRFRPATRSDGTAVRDTFQLSWNAPR